MVRREQDLHWDARDVVDLGDLAVGAAPERAVSQLVALALVLAADERVVEHDDVVQVAVGVGVGEVRRAGQQRGGWDAVPR